MDPNANANAQAPQADPAVTAPPAANATAPETPGASAPEANAVAGVQTADPVATEDSGFEPEIKSFLDNQNIDTTDLKSAVTELAKRNMKLRANQSQVPQSTKDIADVLTGKEPTPPPQQPQQPSPSVQPPKLSDMDIATTGLMVEKNYPDVKADANFYKEMIAAGFKPVNSDGRIDLSNVMRYADYKQKLAAAEKALAAQQPQANSIPQPSNTPEYADVTPVAKMDEVAAQNIIMFSNREKRYGRPVHPQYEEAVRFIQGTK